MSLTGAPGGCTVYHKSLTRSHSVCDRLLFAKATMAPKKKLRRSVSINQTKNNADKMFDFIRQDNILCDSDIKTFGECEQIFLQYRNECQQLIRSSRNMAQEKYIVMLEKIVNDLLDQNQCLVQNITEIQQESTKRVMEMNKKLQSSAARTEEVMLALQSHELFLKRFVSEHCCCCCGCDQRLMEFKVCLGNQCNHNDDGKSENETALSRQCLSYDHPWNFILNGICNNNICNPLSASCVHNVSSELRFITLVNNIDVRIHSLEAENDELKKENQLIRELNSLLSFRKGLPITMDDVRNEQCLLAGKMPPIISSKSHLIDDDCLYLNPLFERNNKSTNEEYGFNDDLLAFLSHTPKNDMLPGYLGCLNNRDSLDSFDECRTDSLNDRLDSGCSTDAIPSQTDLHSLTLSDCEEDSFEDVIKQTVKSIALQTKECDNHQSENELNDIEILRYKISLAERLVPKLYSKLFYYLAQRNMLLKQFQQESRARKFCKQELSSLTDRLVFSLKGIEMNAKAIKKKQTNSPCH